MFRGIILVFLGACSFGILSTFVKLAYKEGFTLGDVTGTQVFFGLIVLWTIVLLRRLLGGKSNSTLFKEKLKLVVMGTSTGLVSIFYYKCVQAVPASIAILLLMQFTWMSLVLEAILKRRLPSLVQVGTAVLVLLGTALAGRLFSGSLPDFEMRGVAFGLLAAFCYAIFLMINGAVGNSLHPTTKSALILTGACLLILTVFPPVFLVNGSLFHGLFKWGLLLAVFGTVIPPLFYAYGIPRTGLGLSAILSAAELPVAVMMSSLVLQEEVWPVQWFGVILILVAIALSNLSSLRSRKAAQAVAV
ncbi:threonine/homoserine efflux transporter RhtA [Pontibacter ummariensis]|uniref:Threonine/homoserine efflux transporter RhtA n=1 Tax=Pontibacter ummariensis TaxID=1610492 RepID=A0A239I695_9BACT|nr:DMT family transporter [Pontibacter ummariensis]PRY10022.1 threonine/homoserine efflux transporter RhtA [Pontibacter ummariensis]SNS89125.1 Threonine/homoserine efflux transporter RhtA [Pontibacter ummariensis]